MAQRLFTNMILVLPRHLQTRMTKQVLCADRENTHNIQKVRQLQNAKKRLWITRKNQRYGEVSWEHNISMGQSRSCC